MMDKIEALAVTRCMLTARRMCAKAAAGARRAAPGLLERPAFSDVTGQPVVGKQAPARGSGWRIDVSNATAVDGWQYGSVFK